MQGLTYDMQGLAYSALDQLADPLSGGLTVNGISSSLSVQACEVGQATVPRANPAEKLLMALEGTVRFNLIDIRGQSQYAVLLHDGDFLRIPGMTIHWQESIGAGRGRWIEAQSPHRTGLGPFDNGSVALFDASERVSPEDVYGLPDLIVDQRRYDIDGVAHLDPEHSVPPDSWYRCSADVPEYTIDRGYTEPLWTRFVYGTSVSLMHAVRPAGYHSTPHVHAPEQLNIVTEGEIDGYFIDKNSEGRGYHLKAGHFWRVPPMSQHWAWNRSDGPVTLVESHCPGMEGDPVLARGAVALRDTDDDRSHLPVNLFVDVDRTLLAAAEADSA